MLEVSLYDFSKRENSTKRPSGDGFKVNAVLKENTSLYNPSFLLEISILNAISQYKYLKWDTRFYYVDDVIIETNYLVRLNCSIDVLATWKNSIAELTTFQLYSTIGYDVGLVDTRLSSNPEVIRKTSSTSPFGDSSSRYIVGLILSGKSDVFSLDYGNLVTLTRAITSSGYGDLFTDLSNGISKLLSDTSKCITSCYINPVCYNLASETTPILAGGYYVDGLTLRSPNRNKDISVDVSIPWAFPLNDFRNRSHFTALELYLPGYGTLPLNADNFFGRSSINIEINVDSGGGEITYYIEGIAKCTCNVLCPVQCTTTSTGNMIGGVANAISSVGSAMVGNVIGASASAFGAIVSSLETNPGTVGSTGGQSNFNIQKNIVLTVIAHNTNVEPSSIASAYGRPCNKVKGITNGYNQTANASVDCKAPLEIKRMINSYLNGGIYYE